VILAAGEQEGRHIDAAQIDIDAAHAQLAGHA
jgi:hypothetical protein